RVRNQAMTGRAYKTSDAAPCESTAPTAASHAVQRRPASASWIATAEPSMASRYCAAVGHTKSERVGSARSVVTATATDAPGGNARRAIRNTKKQGGGRNAAGEPG